MSFGTILKSLREEKGIRQEDLGKIFNVGKSAVSQWENDLRTPDTDTIVKLADYFNVSIDYLLGRTDNPLFDNADIPVSDSKLRLVAKEWPETISILYRKGKPTPERDKRAAKIMEVAIPADDIEDE